MLQHIINVGFFLPHNSIHYGFAAVPTTEWYWIEIVDLWVGFLPDVVMVDGVLVQDQAEEDEEGREVEG